MAGDDDFGRLWSCTSRSNIWEVAGDAILGEPENARVGEEGANGRSPWPSWIGEAVDRAAERVATVFDGSWEAYGLPVPGPALD